MEKRGLPRFFNSHSSCVRSVAYNPCDRYQFCSGGNDGNICIYHAGRAELLNVYSVISVGLNRHISAVRFNCDGKKILAVTTSRRLAVLDAELGTQLMCYDNCAFSGRERAALAVDPNCPYIAVCSYVNGKGITLFDFRMPLPLDFIFDFHSDIIRDIVFLHDSWPFNKSSQNTLLTLSSQGVAKVTTIDGRFLHNFDFNHVANTIVSTPERYGSAQSDGFTSALVAGGTVISSYTPNDDCHYSANANNVSGDELRYNSNIANNNNSNSNSSNVYSYLISDNNGSSSTNANNNHSTQSTGTVNNSNPNYVSNQGSSNIMNVYQLQANQAHRRNEILFGNVETIRISRAIRQIVASSQHHLYNSFPSNGHFSITINPGNVNPNQNGSNNVEPNLPPVTAPLNSYVQNQLFYHDRWDHSNSDHPQQIWRLRYSSNGAMLYAAGEGGAVRYYRRYPNLALKCLGEVFRHRGDIYDMDISPYDEYLVTASKDKTVGLICLGSPNHGCTEYYELT